MRVKVISRNPSDYLRETKHDIHKVQRNYDPKLHPFAIPREYQRALNAVKLEKIFAKPFLGSLDGHSDVVQCLMKHPSSLSVLVSGAADGEIKIWNIAKRRCLKTITAHSGIVNGLCPSRGNDYFFSIGDGATIKQWKYASTSEEIRMVYEDDNDSDASEEETENDDNTPLNTIIGKSVMMGIDHHWEKPIMITCGESVQLWEESRSEPLQSLEWGVDTVYKVKFNPVETDLCVSAGSDRSLILYDIKMSKPLRKVIMALRSNSVCWNPMEAFNFTAASEDHDLYTFDMRKLSVPLQVHKDHVSAVIDVDYSPTGKEFVSGSYDKTIRIFPVDKGRSREVYHTKRMQRLTSVIWSYDSKYVLCGSDEMDIRIWKANASEKIGPRMFREEAAFRYQEKLKEKFSHHPEIGRISRHRHVPKHIRHSQQEKRAMLESRKRKEANRRAHSKPGTVPYKQERTKHIVTEEE
ncbi:ribosomal processing protein-like protein [Dinothrombium tinctorium]|uniref:DDB1- and CUL4-associated factor 13 n=1 Tax=Dinothrombium tinctorium TaxID=1965070 RepID=A0A443R0V2_9ACAR|nr:ribosomal processing protein-like protein [Dinothrombium tinctorium]